MRISLMTLSLFPSLRAQAWIALHQGIYSHLWWSEKVTQSCPTLCDPVDCSLPGSSVHGIFQARILECISISFSRVSSSPRDWNQVSYIVGRCFTIWATREEIRGFPGGPVVKTPHFHGRGHMFDPWSLVRDPACCAVQSNESKEEESEGMSCSTVTQGWR